MTAASEHEGLDQAAGQMRERAAELTRVWHTRTVVDPETWQPRYDQAVRDFEAAEAAYGSARLWDDFETAARYSPAPPEPEAGQ